MTCVLACKNKHSRVGGHQQPAHHPTPQGYGCSLLFTMLMHCALQDLCSQFCVSRHRTAWCALQGYCSLAESTAAATEDGEESSSHTARKSSAVVAGVAAVSLRPGVSSPGLAVARLPPAGPGKQDMSQGLEQPLHASKAAGLRVAPGSQGPCGGNTGSHPAAHSGEKRRPSCKQILGQHSSGGEGLCCLPDATAATAPASWMPGGGQGAATPGSTSSAPQLLLPSTESPPVHSTVVRHLAGVMARSRLRTQPQSHALGAGSPPTSLSSLPSSPRPATHHLHEARQPSSPMQRCVPGSLLSSAAGHHTQATTSNRSKQLDHPVPRDGWTTPSKQIDHACPQEEWNSSSGVQQRRGISSSHMVAAPGQGRGSDGGDDDGVSGPRVAAVEGGTELGACAPELVAAAEELLRSAGRRALANSNSGSRVRRKQPRT